MNKTERYLQSLSYDEIATRHILHSRGYIYSRDDTEARYHMRRSSLYRDEIFRRSHQDAVRKGDIALAASIRMSEVGFLVPPVIRTSRVVYE